MNSQSELAPIPPFAWPDPRVSDGIAVYGGRTPFDSVLADTTGIAGVLSDLGADGVAWIAQLLAELANLRCRLLLSIYPAGPTLRRDMEQVLTLQQEHSGRAEFRLVLLHRPLDGGSNVVFALQGSDHDPLVAIGPTAPFYASAASASQVNFVFHAPVMLQEGWLNWFERAWWRALPLTTESAKIPNLVPAQGSAEAARMWSEYVARCQPVTTPMAAQAVMEVDRETGRVEVTRQDGTTAESPLYALGVRRDNTVLLRVAALSELGEQVMVNRRSGAGPLDDPMKPHWFGDQASTKMGTILREVKYRVSVLDRETLRVLENRRKDPRALLEALSFSIADGVRWMPHKAKAIFERELERANSNGLDLLRGATGGDIDRFVHERAGAIIADAQAILRQVRPDGTLRPEHIDEMLNDLAQRLSKATVGRFSPQFAYSTYYSVPKKPDRKGRGFKVGSNHEKAIHRRPQSPGGSGPA